MEYTRLTDKQKMEVIGFNFYSQADGGWSQHYWNPKKGDYYTTPRADNELYKIVDEDEEYFYTVYCHDPEQNRSSWKKDEFLKGFGLNRIYVHPSILTT